MAEIARAEEKAGAKIACEPIYKQGTTINGNYPPKTWARTHDTPLPGLSLTQSSLLHVPPLKYDHPGCILCQNVSKAGMGIVDQM